MDGGCFPALKAPEPAPLTKARCVIDLGRLLKTFSGLKRAELTSATVPGAALPAPVSRSSALCFQVAHSLCLDSTAHYAFIWWCVKWSSSYSVIVGVAYQTFTVGQSCASLVECRIPSASAAIPSSALEQQPVRSGDSSILALSPPIWSLQKKVKYVALSLIQWFSQRSHLNLLSWLYFDFQTRWHQVLQL